MFLILIDGQRDSLRLMNMRSLLILSVLLALIREDNGQPTVSVMPRSLDLFVGDDVTLICKGQSGPTKWFVNGKEQSDPNSSLLLTAVTTKNNGEYKCERGGSRSSPYTLTVLELAPHAQLSPSVGGAVMTNNDGRNLVLQVDDDLKDWKCFVLRGEKLYGIYVDVHENMKRAVIYAELKEAKRATFWCKKGTQRSNTVTLKTTELKVMLEPPAFPALVGERVALRCVVWGGGKVESAVFYKNKQSIMYGPKDTYIIPKATPNDSDKYSCHATYRYSHISPDAARQEGDSDAQELKVIGGAPSTTLNLTTSGRLKCFCGKCPDGRWYWYRTLSNDSFARLKLSKDAQEIDIEGDGLYSCRRACGNSFSRFSNIYNYKEAPSVSVLPILVAAILMILGVLIVVLFALRRRRSGGSSVQATKRDEDKKTGGDYEQIQLTDKAVYHTLGQSTDKDKSEGGYEALQKKQEDAVYHTLGPGEGQSQGEGQGGYEALKSVKAEVYHTLSSSEKTPAGESEGGYEQLPQKAKNDETLTVEENPYEELKTGQQNKKQTGKA